MPNKVFRLRGGHVIFSKKPSPKKLEDFFSYWKETDPQWIVMQFNQYALKDCYESYSMEFHGSSFSQIKLGKKKNDELFIEVWKGSKNTTQGTLPYTEKVADTINANIHHCFLTIRDQLIDRANTPPKESILNPREQEGHEWIRVSVDLLKKALNEVSQARQAKGPEVSQGLIFSGIHPNTKRFTFRLRIFNLDFEITEDEVGCFRTLIYNKKSNEDFKGLEPSLTMVFSEHKQNIANQMIQLLPEIAKTIIF